MLHESPMHGLKLLSGGTYHDVKGSVFPLHSHDYWELVYYFKGTVDSHINDQPYSVQPGVMLLTPPGEAHTDLGVTDYACRYFALEIDADPQFVPRRFVDDEHGALRNACERIVHELVQDQTDKTYMLEVLSAELLIILRRSMQQQQHADERILGLHKMQAYMVEHMSSSIRMTEIAKHGHCALSTMRDWFYKFCNCSPQQYLMRLRINKAYDLLRHSNMKLSAVADLCGFDSVSHLSRMIKRDCSQSPGAIRDDKNK